MTLGGIHRSSIVRRHQRAGSLQSFIGREFGHDTVPLLYGYSFCGEQTGETGTGGYIRWPAETWFGSIRTQEPDIPD